MKVTVIHGQSHKGSTNHLGRMLADKLAINEDIDEYFLPRDMGAFCRGCYSCIHSGIEHCPDYKKLEPILNSLFNNDIVIFTTPVYCMRTTASMKALLDHCFLLWMNHRPDKRMFTKKAVILAGGAGGGMKKAISDIKTSVDNWGISQIWTFGVRTLSFSWDDVTDKKKAMMAHKMDNLADKIRKTNGLYRVRMGQRFHFWFMRLMHIKKWSIPADREHWQAAGWLNDKRPWIKRPRSNN